MGVSDELQIEEKILAPGQLLAAPQMMASDDVSPVKLVPHHPVVKTGRLVHEMPGKLPGVHGPQIGEKSIYRMGVLPPEFPPPGQPGLLGFGLVVGHPPVMGNHQIAAGGKSPVHQQFGGVGRQIIVAVHKLQVIPCGLGNGQVPGSRYPGICLVDHPDAIVHLGVHVADGQAGVPAAVVHQQNLQLAVGLAAHALDAAGQSGRGVVYRYDHAYQGRHGGFPPCLRRFTDPV